MDLKREFPYNDMLHLMEVIWGSLPPRPPDKELKLYKIKFPSPEIYLSLRDQTTPEDRLELDEDHFGGGSDEEGGLATAAKIARWTHRVRKESLARNLDESSDEEIKLPVHYRKRKYRPYIAGKLGRLDSAPVSVGDKLATRSCKIPEGGGLARFGRSGLVPEICQSWSCGETYGDDREYRAALYDAREFLRGQWCYSNTINELQLNNWLNGRQMDIKECAIASKVVSSGTRQRHGSNDSSYSTVSEDSTDTESEGRSRPSSRRSRSEGYMSDEEAKRAAMADADISDDDDEDTDTENETDYSHTYDRFSHVPQVQSTLGEKQMLLPPPHVLGDGNPFLLFLIVALIQYHKGVIFKRRFDYNDLLSYFDKFVRNNKLHKVMPNAQKMFRQYLNMRWDTEDKSLFNDN